MVNCTLICALARQNRPLRRLQIVGFAFFYLTCWLRGVKRGFSPDHPLALHLSLDDCTNSWPSQRKVKLFFGVVFYDLTLWVITQLFRATKVKSLFARIQEWYTVNSLKGTQINQEGYKAWAPYLSKIRETNTRSATEVCQTCESWLVIIQVHSTAFPD